MSCDSEIHNTLIDIHELIYPFCDQELAEVDKTIKATELCCENKELINDNGMNVCQNRGVIASYEVANEYIDFYENMYRITKECIYKKISY